MSAFVHRTALRGLLISVVLVLGIAAAGTSTTAQSSTTITTDEPSPTTLSVTGVGIVHVEPDTASISFGVSTDAEQLTAAQAESTETMAAILAAVTAAGVEDRDIQTTNFSVSIMYDYDDNGNASDLLGYNVSNAVTVTVRKLDALGKILDSVVAAGANTVSGVSFYVNDTTVAARQARIAAVEDGITKANDLASAAGMRVSRIVSMSEDSSAQPLPVDVYAADEGAMAGMGSAVPIQAGTTEIQATVSMIIELEAAD